MVSGCLVLALALTAAIASLITLLIACREIVAEIAGTNPSSPNAGLVTIALPGIGLLLTLYLVVRAFMRFRKRSFGWIGQVAAVILGVLTIATMLILFWQTIHFAESHAQHRLWRAGVKQGHAENRRWDKTNIVEVVPTPGAKSCPTGGPISVLLDRELYRADHPLRMVEFALYRYTDSGWPNMVGAKTLVSPDRRRLTLQPDRPLRPGTKYCVEISNSPGNHDGIQEATKRKGWKFTTAEPDPLRHGVRAREIRVVVPNEDGTAQVLAPPGVFPPVRRDERQWKVWFEVDWCRRGQPSQAITVEQDGSLDGTIMCPGCSISLKSTLWAHVVDSNGEQLFSYKITSFADPDGVSFWGRPNNASSFTFPNGIVVEVPPESFDVPTKIVVEELTGIYHGADIPPGLKCGAVFDFRVLKKPSKSSYLGSTRCISVSFPAPPDVDDRAQVFLAHPSYVPGESRSALALDTVGGIRTIDGEKYLSFHPSVQPEPDGGTCSQRMGESRYREVCDTREARFAPLTRGELGLLLVLYESDPTDWTVLIGRRHGGSSMGSCLRYDDREPFFVCRVGAFIPVRTGSTPLLKGRMPETGWLCLPEDSVPQVPVTDEPYVWVKDLDN